VGIFRARYKRIKVKNLIKVKRGIEGNIPNYKFVFDLNSSKEKRYF